MSILLDIPLSRRLLQVANPPDPLQNWQRRTLNLPAHVYLISFIMLLVIILMLLVCHCYRMCRIAFRVRTAQSLGTLVELGEPMSTSSSTRKTPQAVIDQLPVTKYSALYNKWPWRSNQQQNSTGQEQSNPCPDQLQQQGSGLLAFATSFWPSSASTQQQQQGAASVRGSHSRTVSWEGFTSVFQRQQHQQQQQQHPQPQRHSFAMEQLQGAATIATPGTATAADSCELPAPPARRRILRPTLSASDAVLAVPAAAAAAAAAGTQEVASVTSDSSSTTPPSVVTGIPLEIIYSGSVLTQPLSAARAQENETTSSRSGAIATASGTAATAAAIGTAGCRGGGAGGSTVGCTGHSTTEDEAVCTICLEEFSPGEDIKLLPCQHFFHVDCINEWLQRDVTCPLCKHELVTADDLADLAAEEQPASPAAAGGDSAPGAVAVVRGGEAGEGVAATAATGGEGEGRRRLTWRETREVLGDVLQLWFHGRLLGFNVTPALVQQEERRRQRLQERQEQQQPQDQQQQQEGGRDVEMGTPAARV